VNFLKHICQTIGQRFKQVCQLPQIIANITRQRQQQVVLNELEAERLDRIRHPEKYRGK
jgi:hypothetical protein